MVGRKTKFTTQNKTTQGRTHGKTEETTNFLEQREDILGGKDGEETNSKEKQDEGEPGRGKVIFHFFFYSSTTVYSH